MGQDNPAIAWYQYSSETKDTYLSFMVRWMALNYLYEHWYTFNPGSNACGMIRPNHSTHTEDQIIRGFAQTFEVQLNAAGFVFIASNYPELCKSAIKDMRTGRTPGYRKTDYHNMVDRNDIPSVFLTIYYVRCNLMHGSKNPADFRDKSLVRECSSILEGILSTIIEKGIDLYPGFLD